MAKRIELDLSEKEIEDNIQNLVPVTGEKRRRLDSILASSRKTKNINIRISEFDLSQLKQKAADEGVPYQTLISSVLHKYLAGRLVDEQAIRKSLELLARK